MADILTLVFRNLVPKTGPTTKGFKGLSPSPSPAACSSLVVGDRGITRSLLLLAAVTAASELGMRVVFFTQTQIQSLPACLHARTPNPSPDSLKKIKFSYPRTVEELVQQVSCLHELASLPGVPPSLILLDRLEGFLGGSSHSGYHQGEQSHAAHVSALLYDTAAFFTKVLEQRASSLAPCRIIASFQSELEVGHAGGEAPDPTLAVLDRYFQVRCTLDRDRSCGLTAAGLQEAWLVYLSGTGIIEAARTEGHEDEDPSVAQEWRLALFANGSMEFTVV